MKIFKELFWILLFSLLGEVLSFILSPIFTVPGSVTGLLLLFAALRFKWLTHDKVDGVGEWLTNNMGLFFIPPGVAVIAYFDILADIWWQIIIVILVTTFLMMVFTGCVVQSIMKLREKSNQ